MFSDYVLGAPATGMLAAAKPGIALGVDAAGLVGGLTEDKARKKIRERGPEALALLPGVGTYRAALIRRAVADETKKRGLKQLKHEELGRKVGRIGGALAGAGLGALIAANTEGSIGEADPDLGSYGEGLTEANKVMRQIAGGALGAGVGFVAPDIVAAILALMKKRRTAKEQHKSEQRNLALNYIPGVGTYQSLRRAKYGYGKYL